MFSYSIFICVFIYYYIINNISILVCSRINIYVFYCLVLAYTTYISILTY